MKTRKRETRITAAPAITGKRGWVFCLLGALLLTMMSTPAKAQCTAQNTAFQSGEHVMYDLYFNWKFIWKKVGLASLTTFSTTYQSQPAYRFNLLSVGSKKTDFFFKMRDTLTCYVSEKLEPLYFRKAAEEGDRYTVDEAWFSYKDGVSNVKQRRIWHNPIRDVKANNDTIYRCLVFSFVEYKKGKEKEVITFFISDDKNHLPIRLDMYLNFGSAKAFLRSVQGNRYPMTSVVKKK